ncbi:MAG: right-handed parallel beta-helix repeat-containing protein [Lachnospiraceae bacterium]
MGYVTKNGSVLMLCVGLVMASFSCQTVKADATVAVEATTVSKYTTTVSKSAEASDIQSAINKAYNAGGGIVTLSSGTYMLNDSIELKSNVTLQGAGKGSTILKKSSGYQVPDGEGLLYSKGGLKNAIVKKMCIDGNTDTTPSTTVPSVTTYGVLIVDTSGSSNDKVLFDDFKVKNSSMGFHVKGTSNLVVKNSDFSYNGGHYLYYHNLYLRRVYKAKLYQCYFNYSTSGNGVNISYCEDITIDKCNSYSNYFRGIRAADSKRIDIFSCNVYNNKTGDGIILNSEVDGVTDFRIKSSTVSKNGKYGINLNSKCSDGQLWYNVNGGGNASGYLSDSANNVSYR